MPVLFIEAPPGIRPEAKKKMVQKISAAIDEAYHIGDTLIFLREYPAENVAMDGRLQSENPKIQEASRRSRPQVRSNFASPDLEIGPL
jgi:hypothetical protein